MANLQTVFAEAVKLERDISRFLKVSTYPDYDDLSGLDIVDTPDWELATVEAAAWWEVPWKKVAALCECEREEIVPRHVCIRCGTIFNGEESRCTKCEIIERDRRLNQRAKVRNFYRSMMPKSKN